jgi:hypothetical protein
MAKRDLEFGDLLTPVGMPHIRLRFKFYGHGGDVICTYEQPPERGPRDVITKRSSVVKVDESAAPQQ